jgi:hypothetical protein
MKDIKVENDVPFRPATPVGNAKQNVMVMDLHAACAVLKVCDM